MKRLTVAVLITMLLLITYAVTFCTPKQKYFLMTATAYYPGVESCGEWADGYTYTGDVAGYGCIAIDPDAGILKLGQRVYVEGYGYGVCNDIGGAIKGWKIDVCFDTLQEAKEWGVRLVKVYVMEAK